MTAPPTVLTENEMIVRCARHRGVETALRCGKCETPICPRCLVSTPVGARCPACAKVKRFAFLAKPKDLAWGGGLGLGVALLGGVLVTAIPFLGLIGLAILGFAVGEAVSVGANRKRARELGLLAIACLVIGFTLSPVLGAILAGRPPSLSLVLGSVLGVFLTPMLLVGLALGSLLAWMRAR